MKKIGLLFHSLLVATALLGVHDANALGGTAYICGVEWRPVSTGNSGWGTAGGVFFTMYKGPKCSGTQLYADQGSLVAASAGATSCAGGTKFTAAELMHLASMLQSAANAGTKVEYSLWDRCVVSLVFRGEP